MMPRKNVSDVLRKCLRGLKNENFLEFCHELSVSEEEPRIGAGEVDGKSRVEITELLVSRWDKEALDRTIKILREIDCNNEANELAEKAAEQPPPKQEKSGTPPPQFSSAAGPSAAPAPQGHFVDRHRKTLIERVSNMGPVLDHLLQEEVLRQEKYDQVMEKRTTQEQMRFLFSGPLKSGGERSKDVLMDVLKKEERYLILELKDKEA